MQDPERLRSDRRPGSRRDRLAVLLAAVTAICVAAAFALSDGAKMLMPGPLTSAHAAIKNCSACHSRSGSGKLSWVHGLVAGKPLADSNTCLACHKMPATAFFPHGAPFDVLMASTKRLTKIASATPQPLSARAQGAAFPTHDVIASGLNCSTCHQEHQGAKFNLAAISNEKCRSCHVVKFDSFDGNHPEFESYPFKRRTRIIYDHASHFAKHFPEVAKKYPAKRIPDTCSTCHDSRGDKKLMAVAPFEKTCSGCHLDQITGKERVSGPKGVAFLTLPAIDLQTLKDRNVAIGEWPATSEAGLTPFMKVMISRNASGRALIKTVENLNLDDLSRATDGQIKAVASLLWEIKKLFYALISGKASDVLGDLNLGVGATLSADRVADLTASIPRDVVLSAQREWLPNLAAEMANGPIATRDERSESRAASVKASPEKQESPREPPSDKTEVTAKTDSTAARRDASSSKELDPPGCLVRVLGQCLVSKPSHDDSETKSPAAELPPALHAGLKEVAQAAAQPEEKESTSAKPPARGASDRSDELLFPTDAELREMQARSKNTGRLDRPNHDAAAPMTSNGGANPSQVGGAPVINIESDVDPESWAEYGGWYRQDDAIFYRPTGHKDKFIYSWLFLTGPRAAKADSTPAAAVFDFLTSKDAQGACTKCHSVDDIQGRGRLVNFAPLSPANKQGRFTNFTHEPHFGVVGDRGCLTCHSLEKDRAYLKSYEQGNPKNFASNFGAVKKELCQGCHTTNVTRQDCTLCHTYHVNGVITPILNTKIPHE